MAKSAKPSIPTLTRKADAVFSRYIRQRDATTYVEDIEGLSVRAGPCVTCSKIIPVEGKGCGHAGHFIVRGCKLTRYDERNVHLQCNYDNTYRFGEQFKHSQAIRRMYGQEVLDELVELEATYKRDGHKFTRGELQEVIDKYRV